MIQEKIVKKNYDLSFHNTFRLGAQAQFFVMVKNRKEFLRAVGWAKENKSPIIIIAGGSNIILAAKKIKGLVIKFSGEGCKIKGPVITAWAGSGLAKLTKLAIKRSLAGLEWAYGIPGSLGGAIRGNAGAYGSEISRVVAEVEAYDLKKNKFIRLNNRACGFNYRHSIFKKKKNLVIIGAKLKLSKGDPAAIKKLTDVSFKLRFAANPKQPSAGCIFKNPSYAELAKRNKKLALELKARGLVRAGKVAVGYLIDQLGFKGRTSGGAKISQLHANFIVNTGRAEGGDIIKLINLVKKKIKNKYKINPEEEIQYLGG